MTDVPMCGESSHCFQITDLGNGFVAVGSNAEANRSFGGWVGPIRDTYEAFAKLREDMKAGVYDHVGAPTPDSEPGYPLPVYAGKPVDALVNAYLSSSTGHHDARCPVTVKRRAVVTECQCVLRARAERFAAAAVGQLVPFLKEGLLDNA